MASRVAVQRTAEDATVSEEVVSAVAETTGKDPLDLEPLYEVIDPDALDALYRRDGLGLPKSPNRVEFTYAGCEVVVAWDGSVTARESPIGEP